MKNLGLLLATCLVATSSFATEIKLNAQFWEKSPTAGSLLGKPIPVSVMITSNGKKDGVLDVKNIDVSIPELKAKIMVLLMASKKSTFPYLIFQTTLVDVMTDKPVAQCSSYETVYPLLSQFTPFGVGACSGFQGDTQFGVTFLKP